MTSPYLVGDIKRDEGLKLDAYPDPDSGAAPWTIGYGHTGPDVRQGMMCTEEQANNWLAADIATAVKGLDAELSWWRDLEQIRQDCVVNMAFNLGVHKLMGFTSFLDFLKNHQYSEAALDLRGTLWAHQVGDRATRLARQLATGTRQP